MYADGANCKSLMLTTSQALDENKAAARFGELQL